MFVASFVGGASLVDIRARMLAAEPPRRWRRRPRFLPMVDAREAPSLLQRAGFADPVVDVAQQVIRYRGAREMLHEAFAARARRTFSSHVRGRR